MKPVKFIILFQIIVLICSTSVMLFTVGTLLSTISLIVTVITLLATMGTVQECLRMYYGIESKAYRIFCVIRTVLQLVFMAIFLGFTLLAIVRDYITR